jgi:hypothetical protein
MPRYVIERHFGSTTLDDLEEPEWIARRREAARQFPDIVWEHSHAIRAPDGLVTYCIYVAPSEQYVRDHAAAAGVPCDIVSETTELRPA